jgi:Peptidase family M23
MPLRTRTIAAALGALALTIASCSSSTDGKQDTTQSPPASAVSEVTKVPVAVTPVIANLVAAPVPVRATDGKIHLAYELQLTNVLNQDVTITSVKVLARDQTVLRLTGDQVADWTRVIGTQTPTTKLGPGQSGIVWLDVALDESAAVPTDLVHAVGISIPKPTPPLIPATMEEKVAPVSVQSRNPPIIAPPLGGPNWLDGDSCCALGAHRSAVNALSGGLWASERFAIDYVQLQPNGTISAGDVTKVESYPYFGADIYAVADGPVVGVHDGLPEQVPTKSPTGLILEEYGGNHIVQDIGNGNYAFYAHLKTGSLKVKVGDQLTTGQVIAALGNTGNSEAPHLHFHVMSTPDPLRSDGLPFVIKSFRLDSRLASPDELDLLLQGKAARMQPGFTARDETEVSPLGLDVMSYETN